MSSPPHNTQMFALRQPPPETVELGGQAYRLVRVFKHDFFAATCLYETPAPADADMPRVVVKFFRTQMFCGLPMDWCGRMMRDHERDIYRALAGVEGVPRWAGCLGEAAGAIEYVHARPLDHPPPPRVGFFDGLRRLMDAIHARGVAYGDANKRSNILLDEAGRPFLIDYQLALRLREDWPWPFRAIQAACVRYVQRSDLYHLYKHKRRICPGELTAEEAALSRRRGLLHAFHRRMTDPWRWLRRRFLRAWDRAGLLQSPTADLEDHHQPEKATWRESQGDKP